MKVHHVDPRNFAALRVMSGFPKDASRWRRFVFFLALLPITFMRHKLGERVVSVPRILATDAMLFLYMVVIQGVLPQQDEAYWDQLLGGGWLVIVGFTAIALLHRGIRWVKRIRGERLETHCMGLSWLTWGRTRGNAERYMDAILPLVLGVLYAFIVDSPFFRVFGGWLLISGTALFVSENYVLSLELDRQDALLNAEGHEQIASAQFEGKGVGAAVPPSHATPLPTGLSGVSPLPKQQANTARMSPSTEFGNGMRLFFGDMRSPRDRMMLGAGVVVAIVMFGLYLIVPRSPDSPSTPKTYPVSEGAATTPDAVLANPGERTAMSLASRSEGVNAHQLYERGQALEARNPNNTESLQSALLLYQSAADEGDADAMWRLGLMYERGEGGLAQSAAKAVALYRQASDHGLAMGTEYLADMYRDGIGVKRNTDEARLLYEQASNAGRMSAKSSLAMLLYAQGAGDAEEQQRAVALWKEATTSNDSSAKRGLAKFRESARNGNYKAQVALSANGLDW